MARNRKSDFSKNALNRRRSVMSMETEARGGSAASMGLPMVPLTFHFLFLSVPLFSRPRAPPLM